MANKAEDITSEKIKELLVKILPFLQEDVNLREVEASFLESFKGHEIVSKGKNELVLYDANKNARMWTSFFNTKQVNGLA